LVLLLTCIDFTYHSNWHYDLTKSLQGLESIKTKPTVILQEKDIHSFLSASYTFEYSEGKVGEPCSSQLAVTSHSFQSAVPVTMSEIRVNFEGSMKPLLLKHQIDEPKPPEQSGEILLSKTPLSETTHDSRPILLGNASLIFCAGKTRAFEFSNLLREAGDAKAISATFSMATDLFDLEYVHTFEQTSTPDVWWGEQSIKKRIVRVSAASITILPKPPKLELKFVGFQEQYYTNEQIILQLEVTNGEEDDSVVNLDLRLLGEGAPTISLKVPATSDGTIEGSESGKILEGTPIGRIASAVSRTVEIVLPEMDLPATYDLSIKAAYNLVSDMETPIYRSMSTQIEVVNPFEANYDFSPRIHPDPWPSLFTHSNVEDVGTDPGEVGAHGLAQKWCLTARYASFALDELIIEDVDVQILGVNGGIQCHTKKLTTLPQGGLRVAPRSLEEAQFDAFTQKISLDDRGTATLDVSLMIKWRRDSDDSPVNTTILAVPRLLVSSSEPRVLAAVSYSTKIPSMIHFDVTIENPSNHFLTFGVIMEPSEKFAFSGVKQSTLQLVPLSRRTMRFRLLPSVRGEWIGPVHCLIRDRYFQKVLKIAPTEGMKHDKEGILIWVPPEEDFDAY
jgi:trafficking protein particle complex subunit 11